MEVISSVLILFIMIVVGYTVRKLKIVSDEFSHSLSRYITSVALPAFIIISMRFKFDSKVLKNSMILIIMSFIIYAAFILFSYAYTKFRGIDGQRRSIHQFALVFPNVGFMGYPVLNAFLGKEGMFYGAIFNLSFQIIVWTFGVYLFSRDKNYRFELKNVFNPAFCAIIIGYVLFLFSIQLPEFLYKIISILGSPTSSLSMIAIGMMFSEANIASVFKDKMIISTSLLRVLLIPIVTFLVLRGFGFSSYLLEVPVIIVAMPVAANSAIIASAYNGDYVNMSKIVVASTLLSVVTIPLLYFLV